MKRRTRLIIKLTATAVVIASVVVARFLSNGGVAQFGIRQAALFVAFGVSSLVLFAFVVTDFDRWTETVRPVPKRLVRRSVGRLTRRVRRAGAWMLALYGATMAWLWSRVGAALGSVTARSARQVTRFSSWVTRAAGAVLADVGSGLTVMWMWIARALTWAVVHLGEGLTVGWAWAVRRGERALVVYRGVLHRSWTAIGHGVSWTAVHSGEALAVAWAWVARSGERGLVRYRAVMQWLWSIAGRVAHWAASRVATALRVLWTYVARGLAWTFRVFRSGLRRAWLSVAGRGDEARPKPIRRWYTATVDSAFGIPPDGTSVDVFGGRVGPTNHKRRESETVGAPAPGAPEGTDDDAAL